MPTPTHSLPAPTTGREHPATPPARPAADDAGWQTPGYAVVDTALEVTAYLLADR
ncbi:hypothetical protein ACFWZ2_01575 [Streptomyces sp. NPDC059002]|uniref:hypothetical protein n=1 Tax=Streptomyces sp. NPDC059002 TaxID=3346690 RepID=UPI0036B2BA03